MTLEARRRLSGAQHRALCHATTLRIRPCMAQQPIQHLHVFLPMEQHAEWNSWPLLTQLWQTESPPTTWTTRMHKGTFLNAPFDADTSFRLNKWGCTEPYTDQALSHSEWAQLPQLAVLVPLLAFDTNGHRIGYGKGCYDQLLAALPPKTPTIGVALAPPLDAIPDLNPNDQPLSMCCTPTRTYYFH